MTSLYNAYNNITSDKNKWSYYNNANLTLDIDSVFRDDNALEFISSYFNAGGKLGAFSWTSRIIADQISSFRANHIVSAFLLGVLIRDSLHFSMKSLPRLDKQEKRNFLYFWALTCLYHDISYTVEENSQKLRLACNNIEAFIEYFQIEFNLLDVASSRELIGNYYRYRVTENRRIDHGIAGAMLLYDGLMKMWDSARKSVDSSAKSSFIYNGLKYSAEFPQYCCFIAETIAHHNMWRAKEEDISKYEKYKLNALIPSNGNTHLLSYANDNKLLFLLGLIDTFEPIKCLCRDKLKNQIADPYEVLHNVGISFSYEKMEIRLDCPVKCNETFSRSINELKLWLDVEVEPGTDGSTVIRINKTKEEVEVA